MEEKVVKVEYEQDVVMPAVAALIVALLSLIIFLLKDRLFSRPKTILIVGLNDSGKTVLFSKLINKNNIPRTYTSLKENVFDGYLNKNGNSLTIVDFPGAERLRKQLFAKYFQKRVTIVRGLIFVVDSGTFSKKTRDIAEFMYDVLYESGKKLSLLIACNKQDISLAKTSIAIRSALEREFGLVNASREAALESIDGDSKKRILTNSGRNFQWSDLPKVKIDFVECTAMASGEGDEEVVNKVDIEAVEAWIDAL